MGKTFQSFLNSEMNKINIRLATASDAAEVNSFGHSTFYKSNPLKDAYVGTPNDNVFDLMEIDSKGYVLMAIDEATKKLVGVLFAEPTNSCSLESLKSLIATVDSVMDADIMSFILYAETKANIFERLNIEKSFHIQIATVHPDHREQGIARKLFEACFELAKSKGFEVISVDCISFFTTKIAENLEMECISTVTFDEFNNHVGRRVFVTDPPHNECKSYVKRL